jgi:hypothetical protein
MSPANKQTEFAKASYNALFPRVRGTLENPFTQFDRGGLGVEVHDGPLMRMPEDLGHQR